jgi:hypothetical protein
MMPQVEAVVEFVKILFRVNVLQLESNSAAFFPRGAANSDVEAVLPEFTFSTP